MNHLQSILASAADPDGSLENAPTAARSSLTAATSKMVELQDKGALPYAATHFFPIPGGSLEHPKMEAFDQGMVEAVFVETLGANEQEACVLAWNVLKMFGKDIDENGDGEVGARA